MGGMHAQIYQQLEQAELAGIIDKNEPAAVKMISNLGLNIPVFPDWESAISNIDFDVVDICLPTDLHMTFALKAINAGKALFCEKPLALTLAEAEQIRNAAENAGTVAQVGHCIRFWPEYVALKDYIESGKGGKLLSLTLQRRSGCLDNSDGNWMNIASRSGGGAYDLHIHDTDFVISLFGTPNAVSSETIDDARGPSHIFTKYHYKDVIVHALGGWNYPLNWGFQMAFQALFENAAVEYDSNANPSLVITENSGSKTAMPFNKPQTGQSSLGSGNISDLGGYFNELDYFIQHLESGEPISKATLSQATETVRVNIAELESAKSGKTVPLN